MRVFFEEYDDVMRMLALGTNSAFVFTHDGVFQSVFTPTTADAERKARAHPVRFALVACKKTREFAEMEGYDLL